jgi:hypothetical protein
MITLPAYHSLIPQNAAYVRDAILSAHRSRNAIDRTAYAVMAIALAILNTPCYFLQGIFTCDVAALENCGLSLLFIAATVVKIFTSICEEHPFAPPPAAAREAAPQPSDAPPKTRTPPPSNTVTGTTVPAAALPPAAPSPDLTPITDLEKVIIRSLLTTLGKERRGRMFNLLNRKKELEAQGAKVGHIHSLKLLHFIWIDLPINGYSLRAGFCFIRKDLINHLIWSNFKENLEWTIERDRQSPDIHAYIDLFCQTWRLDPNRVRAFVKPPQTPIIDEAALTRYNKNHKCDAEGLVDYLISTTVKEK